MMADLVISLITRAGQHGAAPLFRPVAAHESAEQALAVPRPSNGHEELTDGPLHSGELNVRHRQRRRLLGGTGEGASGAQAVGFPQHARQRAQVPLYAYSSRHHLGGTAAGAAGDGGEDEPLPWLPPPVVAGNYPEMTSEGCYFGGDLRSIVVPGSGMARTEHTR